MATVCIALLADHAQCVAAVRSVLKAGSVFIVPTMFGDVTNERMRQNSIR